MRSHRPDVRLVARNRSRQRPDSERDSSCPHPALGPVLETWSGGAELLSSGSWKFPVYQPVRSTSNGGVCAVTEVNTSPIGTAGVRSSIRNSGSIPIVIGRADAGIVASGSGVRAPGPDVLYRSRLLILAVDNMNLQPAKSLAVG